MSQQWRSRLAMVMLAASSLAIIATTPPRYVSESVEGDVGLRADAATSIVVRFKLLESSVDELGETSVDFDFAGSESITATIQTTVDGRPAGGTSAPLWEHLVLTEGCLDGCLIESRAELRPIEPSVSGRRTEWRATLRVVRPAPQIEATVVEGHWRFPRHAWLLIGALLGASTAWVWRRRVLELGPRVRAISTGLVVLAWASVATVLGRADPFPDPFSPIVQVARVAQSLVLIGIAALVLVGMRRLTGGPSMLPTMAGWVYLWVMTVVSWRFAEGQPTYNPVELAFLGFVVIAPGAAMVARGYATTTAFAAAAVVVEVAIVATIWVSGLVEVVERGRVFTGQLEALAGSLLVLLVSALALVLWVRGKRALLVFATGSAAIACIGAAFVAYQLLPLGGGTDAFLIVFATLLATSAAIAVAFGPTPSKVRSAVGGDPSSACAPRADEQRHRH